MTARRPLVEFASEHPDFPRWGSPEFAPMQAPTRLTLMLSGTDDEVVWRSDWYRRRLRGEMLGPLERYRDCWAVLTGDEGGWPSGAVACEAESRTAGLDAVIESAGGIALEPS